MKENLIYAMCIISLDGREKMFIASGNPSTLIIYKLPSLDKYKTISKKIF
jgi:hypothetical protein